MRFAGWFALAAVMVAAVTVTAFALTRGGGPTPPKRSLAGAIRAMAKDKPVAGLAAKFRIDTGLVPGGSSSFSVSPLNGATGSVWAGKGGVRMVVRSAEFGTTELGFSKGHLVLFDRQHHVAYVLPVAAHHSSHKAKEHKAASGAKPTDVGSLLNRLRVGNILSGAIPGNIAGRPEYTVRMSPRHNGGLFGAFELAWDAAHRIPLRFAVYPKGSSTPAFAITVTSIHYGRVPTRALTVRPPRSTKIVHVHLPSSQDAHSSKSTPSATGIAAVQRAVNFPLAAPAVLAGLPRTQVRSVDLHGPAALVTYGRGLGTVFVLEQRMAANEHSPLASLPTASVSGAPAHELETTLGSLLQFSHGGVTYTVVGSQPAGTIMAAAQAIG
jgi:hypothetical protein